MNVRYIATPEGTDHDLWFDGAGWYFTDETSTYNGPYSSSEECERAHTRYNLSLSYPEHPAHTPYEDFSHD